MTSENEHLFSFSGLEMTALLVVFFKNEPALKPSSRPPQTHQMTGGQKKEDLHQKVPLEDAENCPPSPSLPRLPRCASPALPPRLPSLKRLSAEDGSTDEELAMAVDVPQMLFPEGGTTGW